MTLVPRPDWGWKLFQSPVDLRLLPASSERFVNGNQGGDGARLAGSETILRFKERAFSVEYAGLLLR